MAHLGYSKYFSSYWEVGRFGFDRDRNPGNPAPQGVGLRGNDFHLTGAAFPRASMGYALPMIIIPLVIV
jgi:hypothetical protein